MSQEINENIYSHYYKAIEELRHNGNMRSIPIAEHDRKWIWQNGNRMLNLSSNDYLGLGGNGLLIKKFYTEKNPGYYPDDNSADNFVNNPDMSLTASSARLLTGSFNAHDRLEKQLSQLYNGREALTFGSGYHMNSGILPAIADNNTLILADKLVHASIIDGIRLSDAKTLRYRHQDYKQLTSLVEKYRNSFERIIIVTESIFSMDGDIAQLDRLIELKQQNHNIMLYLDEAHAVGVRGEKGLGLAEEMNCIDEIDFLCGTFGKALASVGAFVICNNIMKQYLINKMRTFIFTTALPPVNITWTSFILDNLPLWKDKREHLANISEMMRIAIKEKGYNCMSDSQIIPMTIGESEKAIEKAAEIRLKGFYVLPVRPPTVPEGTSRLRFSLTAEMTEDDIKQLISIL